jgi:signal recognition particle receptor subunit beta
VPGQSENQFRYPTKPQVSDVYIAVMGVTGAGKSTFISQLADSDVPIGTGLHAC